MDDESDYQQFIDTIRKFGDMSRKDVTAAAALMLAQATGGITVDDLTNCANRLLQAHHQVSEWMRVLREIDARRSIRDAMVAAGAVEIELP